MSRGYQYPQHTWWEILSPLVFAVAVTAPTAYVFEILIPFVEAAEYYERKCIEKGGMVYEPARQPKMCIKTEIIKIE